MDAVKRIKLAHINLAQFDMICLYFSIILERFLFPFWCRFLFPFLSFEIFSSPGFNQFPNTWALPEFVDVLEFAIMEVC